MSQWRFHPRRLRPTRFRRRCCPRPRRPRMRIPPIRGLTELQTTRSPRSHRWTQPRQNRRPEPRSTTPRSRRRQGTSHKRPRATFRLASRRPSSLWPLVGSLSHGHPARRSSRTDVWPLPHDAGAGRSGDQAETSASANRKGSSRPGGVAGKRTRGGPRRDTGGRRRAAPGREAFRALVQAARCHGRPGGDRGHARDAAPGAHVASAHRSKSA